MKRKNEDKDKDSQKKQKASEFSSNEKDSDNIEILPFPLPYELHLTLMEFLPMTDLTSMGQTCKKANEISGVNILWKKFAREEGVNEKTLQETQRPIKEHVKDARIVNNSYSQDLITLMGGVDMIASLPVIPRKDVNVSKPDIQLLTELKGHKIWRGVSIKEGSEDRFYIALCTKQNLDDDPIFGLLMISDDKENGSIMIRHVTKNTTSILDSDLCSYDLKKSLKSLISRKSLEDLEPGGITPSDPLSDLELIDPTECKKQNRCIIS